LSARKMQAEGLALHEQRMNHVDMRLAEITDKLDGLIGFMNRQRQASRQNAKCAGPRRAVDLKIAAVQS
jgi:hypothetical protein